MTCSVASHCWQDWSLRGGLLLAPITVPRFRDLCDTFLLQHVEKVAISPLDLTHVPLNLAAAFPVSAGLGILDRPEDQGQQTAACLW